MTYKPQYPTVEELATMTAQDVFDRCAVHLTKQNAKSQMEMIDPDGAPFMACRYRGPQGMCCGVGVLIPLESYEGNMETRTVAGIAAWARGEHAGDLAQFLVAHHRLLSDIQNIHDRKPVDEWPDELQHLADHLGVNTLALDAALAERGAA